MTMQKLLRHTLELVVAMLSLTVSLSAQVIDPKDLTGAFGDKLAAEKPKQIYDQAQYRALYEYQHQKDPGNPYKHKVGWTVLFVGERYSMFLDYFSYQADSINDSYARAKRKENDLLVPLMSVMQQKAFKDRVVRGADSCFVVSSTGLKEYAYEEPLPQMEWSMTPGDTIVAGVKCKKALTHFRGRDYVAWYAPEVPIPDGPYKFTGLPGLIFCLYDTGGQYSFTLGSLSAVSEEDPVPIYRRTDYPEETRSHILQMHKNFCADPARGLMSKRGVTIPEETLKSIKPLPFNPIELE